MRQNQLDLSSSVTVKQFLLDRGATVAGVAPAPAFEGAPAGHSAEDVLPGARSVIVFGIKLVSGVVNWPQLIWQDDTKTRRDCWRVYDHCAFNTPNTRLMQIGMELAIDLELDGAQAIFFPGSDNMSVTELNAERLYKELGMPQPLDQEKITRLAPDLEKATRYAAPFSYRHAAVAAGLATFGASNLALHPIFGPRIRWNVVITDQEFEQYDPPLTEQVCLYDKGCRVCIETCPYEVFGEVRRFEFAGLSNPWATMAGTCYYNSTPCGGTCLQTCPAGRGDVQMKRQMARRFPTSDKKLLNRKVSD